MGRVGAVHANDVVSACNETCEMRMMAMMCVCVLIHSEERENGRRAAAQDEPASIRNTRARIHAKKFRRDAVTHADAGYAL